MIGELGTFALILALLVSIVQGTFGIWGGIKHNLPLMRVARPAAILQLLLTATAFGLLTTAFLQDDFSIRYVVRQSNSLLPEFFKVAAVWGGHEGSLLLWVLMLSGWGAAVAVFGRNLPLSVQSLVGGVLGWIGSGLYLFILLTSSPFIRQLPAASDGADLNPLLQDLGLIFHPPLLYMGYVGFSVAFAFAVAALISGRLDATWARWSRPWTTAAWAMLTLGIMLGSAWAYYELGWGGWWFWDPVENASFMPWLAGTALIHSLAVAEKRNAFKHWTVLLAISTFSLSLLGTFLVRSGVLTSVHAFATDPARGTFILIFLCLVIGTSLALYAWRAPMLEGGGAFNWCSRESLLLANNVLLVVACATVFIGTLYPLLIDALGQGKLSVGPPYFNSVFIPLMMPALLLMGLSGTIRWKHQDGHGIWLASKVPMILAIVGGALLPLCWGTWRWGVAIALTAALWISLMAVRDWSLRLLSYRKTTNSWWQALCKVPASFSGMHIAHFGMAVFVAGVAVVSSYEHEDDLRMAFGDTHQVAGYTLRFDAVKPERASNYASLVGYLTLSQDGKTISVLKPEKRQYFSSQMPMTEAAIHHTQIKDIYVALGEPIGKDPFTGDWLVRIHYKPLVGWIWYGCLLMALGGLIALSDKRYRQKRLGKKSQ
ncbi:heme lyase CcmF/NrfE family subunit [Deefgea tanakiae]|uniref:Heme lyase CcmF/NrfE family subunit n=1 Tax=Deefgea tanakiae TaxID=2865840 RepID=A0ABX8Z3T4_9NEIS|nr:heme lyase CcmF/NrfE family subunit [Deefgea tanakiae]QZA77238.1 heme lyase CcmF/NrfE family subunit [Deefgea tanakiae]